MCRTLSAFGASPPNRVFPVSIISLIFRHDRAHGRDFFRIVGRDLHRLLAAVLALQEVQVEDDRVANSLDAHEDDEPEDALREEAVACSAFPQRADPIERPWENYCIASDVLPSSCDDSIQYREQVLVHDVLPADQNLIQEEFDEVEDHGHHNTGQESIVAESGPFDILHRVISIVRQAVLLFVSCELVELADLPGEHGFSVYGQHKGDRDE